jgi:hypothetical protein
MDDAAVDLILRLMSSEQVNWTVLSYWECCWKFQVPIEQVSSLGNLCCCHNTCFGFCSDL